MRHMDIARGNTNHRTFTTEDIATNYIPFLNLWALRRPSEDIYIECLILACYFHIINPLVVFALSNPVRPLAIPHVLMPT